MNTYIYIRPGVFRLCTKLYHYYIVSTSSVGKDFSKTYIDRAISRQCRCLQNLNIIGTYVISTTIIDFRSVKIMCYIPLHIIHKRKYYNIKPTYRYEITFLARVTTNNLQNSKNNIISIMLWTEI